MLTRDNYFYIFDWQLQGQEGQTFSDPKQVVNMNNLQSYDIKKDMRIELVEQKKNLFNTTKKTVIKVHTVDDLEAWCKVLDKILNIDRAVLPTGGK